MSIEGPPELGGPCAFQATMGSRLTFHARAAAISWRERTGQVEAALDALAIILAQFAAILIAGRAVHETY